jgi:hypothetical protein
MRMAKSVFDVFFKPRVDGVGGKFMNGENLSVLLTLAESIIRPKKRVLEMYCNLGNTAVALASIPSAPEVFAFDVCQELEVFPLDRSGEVALRKDVGSVIAQVQPSVRKRITFEVSGASDLKSLYGKFAPYDLVHVDGNHTWRGVAADTKLAVQFVTDCGVIVWDDYWDFCPEVISYVNVLNRRIGDRIVWVEETRMCFIQLQEGEKSILEKAVCDL